ncbi:MAG TPA: hypothetical protein VK812_15845 [Candidatus Binatus sp.]|jgi:hypothetical protein|nr:hypothetical protein [Candidatus Binatus sp.]
MVDPVKGQESVDQEDGDHQIDTLLKHFVQQADSLAETLPLTMYVVSAAFKHADEQYQKYIDENELRTVREQDRTVVYVPDNHQHRFHKLANRRDLCGIATSNIPRVFVVSLVSHFDTLVGGMLRALFNHKRELLNASERSLTFKELSEFDSIEDAWNLIIEKEVETVIRKSHLEQFEWMEQKFKLPLRKDLPSWPVFLEVTERRNLFVHCDGVVSTQYLKMCREHGFPMCEHIAAGAKVEVTRDYFRRVHECVMEIGIKLCHVLWRKLDPGSRSAADRSLNNVCLQMIVDSRYRLAMNLLDFATNTLKAYSDDQSRRIFVINQVQAYKWSGDQQKALELLGAEDWSACDLNFQLAVTVLRDEFVDAADLMRKIGAKSAPSKDSYLQWPLFKEFRKTEAFKTAFEGVFGEKPSAISSEIEQPDAPDSEVNKPDPAKEAAPVGPSQLNEPICQRAVPPSLPGPADS